MTDAERFAKAATCVQDAIDILLDHPRIIYGGAQLHADLERAVKTLRKFEAQASAEAFPPNHRSRS